MEVFEFSSEVLAKMAVLANESDFPVEAYEFVARETTRLERHRSMLPVENRGVTDQALCWKLHDRALITFGENAVGKLANWNIHDTRDFGRIVYGLVGIGLLAAQDGDSVDNFDGVFDFKDAFDKLHFEPMPVFPTRWRVSALLVVMTVAAIAFAGISKRGMDGALGTLLSTWLVILGAVTIYLGISNRSKDWLLAVATGIFFTGLGMMGFVLMTN